MRLLSENGGRHWSLGAPGVWMLLALTDFKIVLGLNIAP